MGVLERRPVSEVERVACFLQTGAVLEHDGTALQKLADGLFWGAGDFVVEHRKVKGKTKTNWVCWAHLGFTDIEGTLVGFLGTVNDFVTFVWMSNFYKVSVV